MDKYEILAIIGNGFDLAHGLKTSFFDFAHYMLNGNLNQKKLLMDFFDIVHQYSKEEKIAIIDEWYDFENVAKKMVSNFSQALTESSNSMDKIDADRNQYYNIFDDITKALIEYLKKCENECSMKLKNVEPYLSEKTLAINFNYTNTVNRYNCKQVFIHGSLYENEIVLGYDDYFNDGAYDFANYEDRFLLKDYERGRLAFSRWLSSQNIFDMATINRLKEDYLDFMKLTETGRGKEEGDYDKYDERIKIFEEHYKDILLSNGLTDDEFKNVKHIVIIGHGIKSDRLLLDNILNRINSDILEDVTIFLYAGISLRDLREQVAFFRSKFVFKKSFIRFAEYNTGEIDFVLLKRISNSLRYF